jgi:hypothetical protein
MANANVGLLQRDDVEDSDSDDLSPDRAEARKREKKSETEEESSESSSEESEVEVSLVRGGRSHLLPLANACTTSIAGGGRRQA